MYAGIKLENHIIIVFIILVNNSHKVVCIFIYKYILAYNNVT